MRRPDGAQRSLRPTRSCQGVQRRLPKGLARTWPIAAGKGFRVVLTTTTGEDPKTVIVGATDNNPEVLFVKSFFKDAVVRSDQRVDSTVDVLVGNKYGGFNKDAKTTYQVKTTTLCLPSQTPSATPALGG